MLDLPINVLFEYATDYLVQPMGNQLNKHFQLTLYLHHVL